MPEPRVSIIVVTARSPARLVGCLDAVERHAPPGLPIEVVVVLNAAEPGLGEAVRDRPVVRLVTSDVSLGSPGGLNFGVRHARGDLIHVLHDDAVVEPGWLDPLVAVLDERQEVGAVGSRVLWPDGTIQAAGNVLWRDGRTTAWLGVPPDAATAGDAPYLVDYCASASLLVRRAAWEAVGGPDEVFHPAYYTDVDLAMALRGQGYVSVCEPRSRVRHQRGGSTREPFRLFISERNRKVFVVKWAGELEHQEPYAEDPDARSRAAAATERRALTVASSPRPAGSPGGAWSPIAETEVERLRREYRQLRRDVAVKAAYIDTFEEARAELEVELVRAGEERARLEADAQAQIARVARRLDAIEAGGWWRLRARLLPLLRAGGRLRRITRRAGSSRTG